MGRSGISGRADTDFGDGGAQIDLEAIEGGGACLQAGEVADLGDQGREASAGLLGLLEQLRCCVVRSGPARSFSSIRMYPATTVIGVRNSWTASDRTFGQRGSTVDCGMPAF